MTYPVRQLLAYEGKRRRISPASRPGPNRSLDLAYDPHKNNFGFLRFCLATAVIWSHSYTLLGRRGDPLWILSGQTDAGSLAVDGFFVLSGFLVTQSWIERPNVRVFAFKRFLRLAPAALVAMVFGAFVIGPLGTNLALADYLSSPGPWRHFLGIPFNRYLFVKSCFVTNPIPTLLNTPLWSLRYEILCYALVPLLGVAAGRRLGMVTLLVFATSLVAFTSLPAWPILSLTSRLLACFTVGMVLFLFKRRVPLTSRLSLFATLVLGLTFVIGGLRSVAPWAGGYLLVYLACHRSLRLQNFCRYGDFSYGLYVFACPIQQLVMHYLGPELPVPFFFGLAYLPTLAFAALSWHFVEAPALMLKRAVARVALRGESTSLRATVPVA